MKPWLARRRADALDLADREAPGKPLSAAPGPAGLPIAGSFFEMRDDPLAFFERCAKEHGRVYRLRVFHPFLVVNDAKLVREVLMRQSRSFHRSRRAHEIRIALGEGLVVSDGDKWRVVRAGLQGAFTPQRFHDHRERIARLVDARARRWTEAGTIALRRQVAQLTLAISAYTFFDFDLEPYEEEVADALDVINDEFASVLKAWLPIPLYAPSIGRMRVRRSYHTLAAVARQIMRRAAQRPSTATAWIAKLDADCRAQGLPEQLVLDQVIFLLMASYDTTAVAITYTLYLLSKHAGLQAQIAAELGEDDLDPAATALIKPVFEEAMRLYPPVWGIGREAIADVRLGDYFIPKGTQVMALPYIIHRDAGYFPDPERFAPERFRERRGVDRTSYMPFSMGLQACMGAQFATIESLMIVARLIRTWELADRSGEGGGSLLGITLRPEPDFRTAVARR